MWHFGPYGHAMRSAAVRAGILAAVLALAGVVWVRASAGSPLAAGTVVRVVDGDTVIVRGAGGRTEDVQIGRAHV